MAKETRTVPSRTWSQADWGDYPSTGHVSESGNKGPSILGRAAEMLGTNEQTEGNARFQKSDPQASVSHLHQPPSLGKAGVGAEEAAPALRTRSLRALAPGPPGTPLSPAPSLAQQPRGLQGLPLPGLQQPAGGAPR